jgi:hypothetical protein
MNDLVSMLSEQNLGVNLASDIINCLLFADDIVLIGHIPVLTQILGQTSQIQTLQRELCYWRYYKEILRVSNIYPEYHFSIIGKINLPAKLSKALERSKKARNVLPFFDFKTKNLG